MEGPRKEIHFLRALCVRTGVPWTPSISALRERQTDGFAVWLPSALRRSENEAVSHRTLVQFPYRRRMYHLLIVRPPFDKGANGGTTRRESHVFGGCAFPGRGHDSLLAFDCTFAFIAP